MKRNPGDKKLYPGKLPARLLERLLKRYAVTGPSVVVGPGTGLDAAVIDVKGRRDEYLIAKTDPITFLAEDIGTYAIAVNANDIAVMGGTPRWFLATVLMAERGATFQTAERVFRGLSRACKDARVELVGGHTEITPGVARTIVIGQMLGMVEKRRLVTAAGAQTGDDLILTKGVAIEATSVLARVKARELEEAYPRGFVLRCRRYLKDPGLSVVKDASIAAGSGRVHAMHDPTEGGLATGLHELAAASGCGVIIEKEAIPVLPESRRLCEHYGLDPLGSVASGALLVSLDARDTVKVLKKLEEGGIHAARIGRVTEKRAGVRITEDGVTRPLKTFERDELTRVLR